MKNLQFIKSMIAVFAVVALFVFFMGCQKMTTPTEEIEKEKQFLEKEMFFNPADIILNGDEYIVQGDIVFPRTNVQKMMAEAIKIPSANGKHYVWNFMASPGNKIVNVVGTIPTVWNTAITNAISEWNGLGLNVSFTKQSSNANVAGAINIKYDYLSNASTIAQITYANGAGSIGNPMIINSNPNVSTLTTSKRKMAMVHELGHALGFAHTDEGLYNWVNNSSIGSTCKNGLDQYSVMQLVNSSWTGFTTCDKKVFDYYY